MLKSITYTQRRNMCDCRSISWTNGSKHLLCRREKHRVKKTNFTCPMCLHTKKRFTYHADYVYYVSDDALASRTFECEYCHKYIRSYDSNLNLDKEFFFALDCVVVMTKDSVLLERKNCKDIVLPFFVFSGDAALIKKIKTYTLFS